METRYIGDNLIAIRKSHALSQEDVALLLDLPLEKYVSWELGESAPNIAELILVAKILKVDTIDLVKERVVTQIKSVEQVVPQQVKMKTEQKASKKEYQTESVGKTVLKSLILLFTVVSILCMMLPLGYYVIWGNIYVVYMEDVLFTSNFRIGNFFYWIMILCLIWNIVDMMILLISRSLQSGSFHRVSRILLAIFNTLALLLYIVLTLCLETHLEPGFYIILTFMIAMFVCTILYVIPFRKKSEAKTK